MKSEIPDCLGFGWDSQTFAQQFVWGYALYLCWPSCW